MSTNRELQSRLRRVRAEFRAFRKRVDTKYFKQARRQRARDSGREAVASKLRSLQDENDMLSQRIYDTVKDADALARRVLYGEADQLHG